MARRSDITRTDPAAPGAARPARSEPDEIAGFIAETKRRTTAARRGRLIFALDATMSRQPTWDLACTLQAEMFDAAARAGGIDVQLVYFRGHREARASKWVSDAAALGRIMTGINCRGGLTQIGRVLDHALKESGRRPVSALVFVGDAMEEDVDRLCDRAGRLALLGVPAFMFLEGSDPAAERTFREIARLTGGAFLHFDAGAAGELRALLGAVATFASGGRAALEAAGSPAARRLLADLGP